MSPRSLPRVPSRVAAVAIAVLAAATMLAGCSLGAAAFDPSGPCTTDGRMPGAYPELERLVPASFDGKAPQTLDSGRTCSSDGLGTLAGHGIRELRFAGGVWSTAAESGTSLAVFSAPGLTGPWLEEYYEAGARTDSKVASLVTSTLTAQGRPAERIDVQNDTSLQAIVIWPDATGTVIRVAIVSQGARDGATKATIDAAVQQAIAAFPP
jgi:hypothetical protein